MGCAPFFFDFFCYYCNVLIILVVYIDSEHKKDDT